MADGQSRIAIKFGAPLSGSSKKAQRPPPPSTLGKRHRHHFNADSESEDEGDSIGKHESITAFGADGAEVEDARARERREAQARSETQRREKTERAEDTSRQNGDLKETDPPDEDKPIKWGLTVTKKSSEGDARRTNGNDTKEEEDKNDAEETGTPKTADEQALEALLGKTDSSTGRRGNQRTEDDAYRDATDLAPDVDPLKVYDDHPVEGFGASLLMGQGWDGKMRGPKTKEVKRRPNQMGLGAKGLNGQEDLGDWNHKGSGDKRPRLDEYKREREKERSRRDDRYRDSYKRERDREREQDRDRDRGSDYRHRDREYRR